MNSGHRGIELKRLNCFLGLDTQIAYQSEEQNRPPVRFSLEWDSVNSVP